MEYQLSIETIMMIFFLIAMIFSVWKFYAFLPMETLPDDDTNSEAKEELERLMLQVIKESYDANPANMAKKIYENMIKSEQFDKTHYWRFNQNRLNHIIQGYLLKHHECKDIYDIYKKQSISKRP